MLLARRERMNSPSVHGREKTHIHVCIYIYIYICVCVTNVIYVYSTSLFVEGVIIWTAGQSILEKSSYCTYTDREPVEVWKKIDSMRNIGQHSPMLVGTGTPDGQDRQLGKTV